MGAIQIHVEKGWWTEPKWQSEFIKLFVFLWPALELVTVTSAFLGTTSSVHLQTHHGLPLLLLCLFCHITRTVVALVAGIICQHWGHLFVGLCMVVVACVGKSFLPHCLVLFWTFCEPPATNLNLPIPSSFITAISISSKSAQMIHSLLSSSVPSSPLPFPFKLYSIFTVLAGFLCL